MGNVHDVTMRWIGSCAFFLLLACPLFAQQEDQLWLDFQTSYPFANRYLLENTLSYQTLLNKEGKWRGISTSPTFEYSLFRKLDLLSEIGIGYVDQTEDVSTFELAPMVGVRFYINQNRRLEARLLARYQARGFYQFEAGDWDISNRTRLRGEAYFCINGPNLSTDNLWYLLLDYEEYIVLDQQLDERYANRRRARMGVGYRLNYSHRFDISFTLQSSRNELEEDFLRTDNVFQIKYKWFFNKATPAPPTQ